MPHPRRQHTGSDNPTATGATLARQRAPRCRRPQRRPAGHAALLRHIDPHRKRRHRTCHPRGERVMRLGRSPSRLRAPTTSGAAPARRLRPRTRRLLLPQRSARRAPSPLIQQQQEHGADPPFCTRTRPAPARGLHAPRSARCGNCGMAVVARDDRVPLPGRQRNAPRHHRTGPGAGTPGTAERPADPGRPTVGTDRPERTRCGRSVLQEARPVRRARQTGHVDVSRG